MYVEIERRTVYAVSLCVFQFFLPKKSRRNVILELEETENREKREKLENKKTLFFWILILRFQRMNADSQIDEAFELFDREANGTLTYNNAKTVRHCQRSLDFR